METKDIYILGVGYNTIVYIDLAESCGYKVAGLYHFNNERIGEKIHEISIIDSNANLFMTDSLEGMNFAISVGDNIIRSTLAKQIREKGGTIPTLIHPNAIVSKYADIAEGVIIHANSVIQADATVDLDTVVSYNVSVSHNSKIGRSCYLAFGSTIGAYVVIHSNVLVGQASVIISGKVEYIGKNSIIGAGSVVTKNVESNTIVAGNPARKSCR